MILHIVDQFKYIMLVDTRLILSLVEARFDYWFSRPNR